MSAPKADILKMSPDEYLDYKTGIFFDYADVRRDGRLEWDELTTFPNNLEKDGKLKHASRIRTVYCGMLRRINQCLNRDDLMGSSAKEDFVKGIAYLKKVGWFQDELLPVFRGVYFDWMDANSDGSITLKEWRKYNYERGITDEDFVTFVPIKTVMES